MRFVLVNSRLKCWKQTENISVGSDRIQFLKFFFNLNQTGGLWPRDAGVRDGLDATFLSNMRRLILQLTDAQGFIGEPAKRGIGTSQS